MSKAEILSKWQITLPKEVREELKLQKGDILVFKPNDYKEVQITKGNKEENILFSRATITEKGQITIPKNIRDELGLEPTDILIFEWVNHSIFMRKQRAKVPCPACDGKGSFVEYKLPCFLCDQTSYVEMPDKSILQLLFLYKNRKYKVSNMVLQQEIDDDGAFKYRDFPKIILRSSEYPSELLNTIQDKLQIKLLEEFIPKSVSDPAKFMIPSDIVLNKILDLFVTDAAKQEVRERLV